MGSYHNGSTETTGGTVEKKSTVINCVIEVIDAMKVGLTQKNKALARLLSIREWRFRSNRSNDSGISIDSNRENPQSSVCSIS